jgi:retinol dehydrogenase-12
MAPMRTCVVTGATNGIGLVTASELAKRGDRVIVVGRSQKRIDDAVRQVGGKAEGMRADFARLDDVRALAVALPAQIDVLVNNAGVVCAKREQTHDGFEMTFGVNHLAPFLLTNLVLPKLAAGARVVNVASAVHKRGRIDFDDLHYQKRSYAPFGAYCDSKLANILFTRELARRLPAGTTTNALHPGSVATGFGHNNKGVVAFAFKLGAAFLISPDEGARTSLYLANAPEVSGITGKYFAKSRETAPDKRALDDETARKLWDVSAQLTQQ